MPIYEYRCHNCGKKTSVFWRSLSAVNDAEVKCERCGSARVSRLMSKVRVVRAGAADGGAAADGGMDDALMNEMQNLDENDPRALGQFMRKMAAESGEDLGPEFGEVVGRLEKGEDPEKIERDMGDVFGDDPAAGMGGMDDMGDYAAPENPSAKADAAAEAKDKQATTKKRTVAIKAKPKKATKAKRKK